MKVWVVVHNDLAVYEGDQEYASVEGVYSSYEKAKEKLKTNWGTIREIVERELDE